MSDSSVLDQAMAVLVANDDLPEEVLGQVQLMIRLKTPEVCDEVVDSIVRHRNNVWPHVASRRKT